jgi:hypothetical protein
MKEKKLRKERWSRGGGDKSMPLCKTLRNIELHLFWERKSGKVLQRSLKGLLILDIC